MGRIFEDNTDVSSTYIDFDGSERDGGRQQRCLIVIRIPKLYFENLTTIK